MSGKGSGRRPQAISDDELAQRWAAIFQASEAHKAEQDLINQGETPEPKEQDDGE